MGSSDGLTYAVDQVPGGNIMMLRRPRYFIVTYTEAHYKAENKMKRII